MKVPRDGRLSFAYAFSREATPGDGAQLKVEVSVPGRSATVLLDEEFRLGPAGEDWRWHHWEGSLAQFGGEQVTLTFETRSLDPDRAAYVLWGNPEIFSPRRPGEKNLILIAVDTLRADRLSCYGNTPGTTPAIDSLARDGVLFQHAITSANWTTPSFLALFTGRGVLGLNGSFRRFPEPTLAEYLRGSGYSTRGIVYKAALYDYGFDRGFDVFLNAPRYATRGEESLAKAVRWLDRSHERKFFLFLHFNDPHQPFCHPAAEVEEDLRQRLERFHLGVPFQVSDRHARSVDPWDPMPPLAGAGRCEGCKEDGELIPEFRELVSDVYDDAVRYVDRQIGRFVADLKAKDLYDDSVIVLISDHGETLWDHLGQFSHGRRNVHDEVVRVPLIVKPPAGDDWAAGRRVASQVRLIDVMPTLMELAGLDPAVAGSAARSLVPALGLASETLVERPAFSAGQGLQSLAMRYRGFKYIRYLGEGGGIANEELFDLAADPDESTDVAASHPEVVARMRSAVDQLSEPGEEVSGSSKQPLDARHLEALRVLGYIE